MLAGPLWPQAWEKKKRATYNAFSVTLDFGLAASAATMKPGVVPEAHAYVETAVPLPIAEAYVVQQQPLLTLAAPTHAPDLYEPFGQPRPQQAQRTSIVSTQPVLPEPSSVRTAPDVPVLDKTEFNSEYNMKNLNGLDACAHDSRHSSL
jgi:hypothetical protein